MFKVLLIWYRYILFEVCMNSSLLRATDFPVGQRVNSYLAMAFLRILSSDTLVSYPRGVSMTETAE